MLEQTIQEASAFFVSFYEALLKGLSLDFAVKLALVYGLIVWLAVIIWVIKDITNRTTNIMVQVLAILLIVLFTPIFGLPVYLLVRPRTTLFEQYYEETSLENMEDMATVETVETEYACPECHGTIERNYKFCPHCRFELMADCVACKAPVHISWKYCPSCGHDQHEEAAKPKKATKKKAVESAIEEVPMEAIEPKKEAA